MLILSQLLHILYPMLQHELSTVALTAARNAGGRCIGEIATRFQFLLGQPQCLCLSNVGHQALRQVEVVIALSSIYCRLLED